MSALENLRNQLAFHLRPEECDRLIAELLHELADRIMAARDRDAAAYPHSVAGINQRIGMREAAKFIRPHGPARRGQDGKDTRKGEFTQPDFFEAGWSYVRGQDGYTAPELTWQFRCVAVAEHPRAGAGRRAFGFMRNGAPGLPWESVGVREGEWTRGWVAVGGGGAGV